MIKEIVVQAYQYSKEKHAGQTRKFINAPYFIHPKSVSRIVEQLTQDPELIAAALLHDVLEENEKVSLQDIKDKFGDRVARLVDELTNKKSERGSMKKIDYMYLKVRKLSSDALIIKLADRLHNMMFLERDVGGGDFKDFIEYYYRETDHVFMTLSSDLNVKLNDIHLALLKKIDAVMAFLKIIHKL